MPIRVVIDETRGLAELVLAGEVTASEVREVMSRHFREAYAALPLGLFDLSDVTRMKVPSTLIGEVARGAARNVDPRVGESRLAIVAPRDELFGLGRMYEFLRGDSPVDVRVFRERKEAELWLGLSKDPAEPDG